MGSEMCIRDRLRVLRLGGYAVVHDDESYDEGPLDSNAILEMGDAAAHDTARLNLALRILQQAEADVAAAICPLDRC